MAGEADGVVGVVVGDATGTAMGAGSGVVASPATGALTVGAVLRTVRLASAAVAGSAVGVGSTVAAGSTAVEVSMVAAASTAAEASMVAVEDSTVVVVDSMEAVGTGNSGLTGVPIPLTNMRNGWQQKLPAVFFCRAKQIRRKRGRRQTAVAWANKPVPWPAFLARMCGSRTRDGSKISA